MTQDVFILQICVNISLYIKSLYHVEVHHTDSYYAYACDSMMQVCRLDQTPGLAQDLKIATPLLIVSKAWTW